MGLYFNPADIQATGVGLAAFLATLLAVFIFLSARNEKLGRPLLLILVAASFWAWFGFLYQVIPNLWWAREMRVISVMGIVAMNILEFDLAMVYLSEQVQLGRALRRLIFVLWLMGAALMGFLTSDLFGTHIVVGMLLSPSNVALAPQAGPLMGLLVAYYILCISFAGALIAWRARAATDESDRRRATILFVSMTLGFALGGTRFAPWFGFEFYPLVGDIGFPLFTFAALYTMQRYQLFNIQVAAAQVLVFVLWTFSFFRILLDPTLTAAIPDVAIFLAVLIIGVFLLGSVTKEVRIQKELAKLTLDKAKSEFVTIAAHQLRTPLSAVRWSFGLLRTGSSLDNNDRDIASKGAQAADNMMYIVNDLLNVARMEHGTIQFDMADGDLRDVVRIATDVLNEAAKKKSISLRVSVPDTPVMTRFDQDKMVMVAENLVDNAIKYTPQGGSIAVELSTGEATARLRVTDTGIGISRGDSARLFERFFRSDRAKRMLPDGSGLGLYIVKTMVDGHKGTVRLEPAPQSGTIATVEIPLVHGPSSVSGTAVSGSSPQGILRT